MKEIDDINTNTKDGELLLAAIAKISTESQTDKTPDEILQQLNVLTKQMFKEELTVDKLEGFIKYHKHFIKELSYLINRSIE